jgi:hypothetical protein
VVGRLGRLSGSGVTVRLTGPAAMWSDFNEANKAAMMKSEALSWPLTLTLLVVAFGTPVAAGLPLVLTKSPARGGSPTAARGRPFRSWTKPIST